jgi:hypothetical protein
VATVWQAHGFSCGPRKGRPAFALPPDRVNIVHVDDQMIGSGHCRAPFSAAEEYFTHYARLFASLIADDGLVGNAGFVLLADEAFSASLALAPS